MDLRNALKSAGVSKLQIAPADVFIVEDERVVLPATKAEDRKFHENGRPCVVITNATLCADVMWPIVSIAPISHRVDLKDATDFPLPPTRENGLHDQSLVMLGHIQPVRKVDLIKKIGYLLPETWDRLIVHLLAIIDPEFLTRS